MRTLVVAPHIESANNRFTLDNKELGNFLIELREEAGLNQKEAAKVTRHTVDYIRMFEKGQRVPQPGRAANLFRWYGYSYVVDGRNPIVLAVKDTRIKFVGTQGLPRLRRVR